MKRFASLATSTALAGALLIAGSAASHAVTTYAMYLQPISSTTITPGASSLFTFRALVDIPAQDANNNGTISLTLGATFIYNTVITGPTPVPGPGIVSNRGKFKFTKDNSEFPPLAGSGTATFDLTLGASFSTATSGALTYQGSAGHTKQTDPNTGSVLTVPAGTYTIGTFAVPITNAGQLDIILPGSIGLTGGPNSARDFVNNTSGDANGVVSTNDGVLTFPNNGTTKFSTLTVNKSAGTNTPAPSSLLVVAMGAVPMVGVLRRRRSLKK